MRVTTIILPFILSLLLTFGSSYLFNFSLWNIIAGNSWFPLDFLNGFGGSNDYFMYIAEISFWIVMIRGAIWQYKNWAGNRLDNPQEKKPKKTKKLL